MHPNPQPASNGDEPGPAQPTAGSGRLTRIAFAMALPRDPIASTTARFAVHRHLDEILPASTVDDVLLAVTELVTNAVLHGTGDIELRVDCDAHMAKAEVIDQGSGFEHQMREDDGLQRVGGKGLHIVGQLAESWGVHEGTTHVWFQIPVDGAQARLERPELGRPEDTQLPDV